MRSYKIDLRKSGSRVPRIELEEMGPMMDFEIRRTHLADDEYFNTACKKVKNVDKPKKVKNVTKDAFGSTLGRVHVPAQKIGTIQTRKRKNLKKRKKKLRLYERQILQLYSPNENLYREIIKVECINVFCYYFMRYPIG